MAGQRGPGRAPPRLGGGPQRISSEAAEDELRHEVLAGLQNPPSQLVEGDDAGHEEELQRVGVRAQTLLHELPHPQYARLPSALTSVEGGLTRPRPNPSDATPRALWRRVLAPEQVSHIEQFGTLAHGKADVARHYSALVTFWARAVHEGNLDDAPFRLLVAAQDQESAWADAKTALRPGERLPESHWLAQGDLAFGRALTSVVESDKAITKALNDEEEKARAENRRWAEPSRRDDGLRIYAFLEQMAGSPEKLVQEVMNSIREGSAR